MRVSQLWLSATAMVLASIPCHARLGETLEECTARYGKPLIILDKPPAPAEKIAAYFKAGISLSVTFVKGVAVAEHMKKADGTAFSTTELSTLIQAESGGMHWTEDDKFSLRRDDGASALLNADRSIDFTTNDFARMMVEHDSKADKDKLKSF